MSSPANQENPPNCSRPSCPNTTSKYTRPKNSNIWKKYCCATCQVPTLKGTSKYSYPNIAPKCLNPVCSSLTTRRTRKHTVWNKFFSTSCQNYTQGPTILSTEAKSKISNTVSDIWKNRTDLERDSIFSNSRSTGFKRKEFIFPSGKIIYVLGNEPVALHNLLKTYNESEIIAGNELKLALSYTNIDNRKSRYYPDIYIPKDNLIIEVKSKWTYSGKPEWLQTNLLKQQACLDAGYNFRFIIY